MYVEGTTDLMGLVLYYPFSSPEQKEKQLAAFIEKAETRYLPVYEKVGLYLIFLLAVIPSFRGKRHWLQSIYACTEGRFLGIFL